MVERWGLAGVGKMSGGGGWEGGENIFCHDKSFVATSILLLRQTRICSDKTRYLWQLLPMIVLKWGTSIVAMRMLGRTLSLASRGPEHSAVNENLASDWEVNL